MGQSVNFLNVIPKTASRLPATMIALLVAGVFGLLLLISVFKIFSQFHAEWSLRSARSQLTEIQKHHEQLKGTYPLLASDTPVVNQVKELDAQVQVKRDKVKALEDLLIRRGFSEFLFGLAQAAPDSLWITQLKVVHSPVNVTISGNSLTGKAVSTLMNHLAKTEAFAEVVFNLFFVKTIKNQPYIRFSIATSALGPEEQMPVEVPEITPEVPKE